MSEPEIVWGPKLRGFANVLRKTNPGGVAELSDRGGRLSSWRSDGGESEVEDGDNDPTSLVSQARKAAKSKKKKNY